MDEMTQRQRDRRSTDTAMRLAIIKWRAVAPRIPASVYIERWAEDERPRSRWALPALIALVAFGAALVGLLIVLGGHGWELLSEPPEAPLSVPDTYASTGGGR